MEALDFINSIILNTEERIVFDLALKQSPMFRQSDKDNLMNVSPLYRVALVQNNKYSGTPSIKTLYTIRDEYPSDLKKVIKLLNEDNTGEHRRVLLIMKSILMSRYHKLKNVEETTYDEFMIKAGRSLVCVYCSKSNNVTIENKSFRSPDEDTETFYYCHECGRKFKETIKIKKALV